jgi:NAD(P)-dependent dehydrogenase (short-subunit alcohol dehydrogenase family)
MKIFITGGSGGIGSVIIYQMLMQGHHVISTFHSGSESDLFQHENLNWVKLDLTNINLTNDFLNTLPKIDVAIHCAGIANSSLVGKQDTDLISNQIAVNLTSSILIVESLTSRMIENGFGRIILFGSIVGRDGGIGISTYSACKSGLHGLVKSVIKELPNLKRRHNEDADFTINIISPGYTDTPMTQNLPQKIRELIVSRTANNRFVHPNEIAALVTFLLSDGSKSINGADLEINGGSTL